MWTKGLVSTNLFVPLCFLREPFFGRVCRGSMSNQFKSIFRGIKDFLVGSFVAVRKFWRNHPLVSYSINRTVRALFTVALVVTATFLLLRMLPPDTYWASYISKFPITVRPQIIAAVKVKLGIDKPVIEQLFTYFYNILPIFEKTICLSSKFSTFTNEIICLEEGKLLVDFGTSFVMRPGAAVWPIIAEAMPYSFYVGLGATAVEMLLGYPLGILMARYNGKLIDRLGNFYIVIIDAIPPIVYYYTIYLVMMRTYSTTGIPFEFDIHDTNSWYTPMVVIGIAGAAEVSLWIRRYMVDELNSDYVKFARSKGLSENKILYKHVFRNAIVFFVRTIPMAFLFSLMGSYFLEKIFLVPGIGDTLINAIQKQDNTFVQALVLIFSIISTVAFLLGDLVTVLFDPRVALVAKD